MTRDDDVVAVSRRTRLVRIFTQGGNHRQTWDSFRYVGPLPHGRFDAHPSGDGGRLATSPDHGITYFSLSLVSSVASVFETTSTVDRATRGPHVVVLRPRRGLRLLDLTGYWPTRVGASQEISSGIKQITQAWARAIRGAFPDLDGLWFRSSMDAGNPSIALWDPPASSALPDEPDLLLPLAHPSLDEQLTRACDTLNYILLD